MKLIIILQLFLSTLLIAKENSVEIIFNQPEKFIDFTSEGNRNAKDRERMINQLSGLLADSVKKTLSSEFNMKLTINNVDMSGRFIYGTGEAVRVVNDADRTSLEFNYQLMDKNGLVVSQGDVNLSNRNPQKLNRKARKYKHTYFSNEMVMFNSWLQDLKF